MLLTAAAVLLRSGSPLLSQLLCRQLVSLAGTCAARSLSQLASLRAPLSGDSAQSRRPAGQLALAAAALHFILDASSGSSSSGSSEGNRAAGSASRSLAAAVSAAWPGICTWVQAFADLVSQQGLGDAQHEGSQEAAVQLLGPVACEAAHAIIRLQALRDPDASSLLPGHAAAAPEMLAACRSLMVSPRCNHLPVDELVACSRCICVRAGS